MGATKPAPSDPAAGWLTTAEAAVIANRTHWTVQRWIRTGLLPARLVRGKYRQGQYLISRDALDAFLRDELDPPGGDPLAAQIRRVLAEGGNVPEPTDDQIRLIARLLPPPRGPPGRAAAMWPDMTRRRSVRLRAPPCHVLT